MKRILNYPGSKWTMANWIIDHMPAHEVYLEPFFGSGAVFFNKQKKVVETINDIDCRLINMFTQMRDNPTELARLTHYTLYSRKEYELSQEKASNPLEDARRMLVRCWMAIGGKTNSNVGWRRNVSENGPYNTYEWHDLQNRIFDAAARLKDVQIECKDAVQLINEYNRPNVLIYADPPYVHSSRVSKHYENEYSDTNHIQLLQVLKEHQGPVLLSGYDSDLYKDILQGWNHKTFEIKTGFTGDKRKTAVEVLWINPIAFESTKQMTLFEIV
ncbi:MULTISPECIES: DNA adenine methylase [Lysinibacillus]|uniref:DNA adenine methylase n=1 Tax=Lysinibacillus TaxID=400634 RepID=UPI0004D3C3E9|nr:MULTISPECIES: DNA adenine methylase [Lysinibacillus]AJK87666.1 DNA methyltransferase [Lysinibacillus fusiformis]KHK48768.1 DNA methyltransferase [Lysinibacillus sp. A1]